jgi:hypothetical protein
VDDLQEDAELIFTYATLQEHFHNASVKKNRAQNMRTLGRQSSFRFASEGAVPYQLFCLNHPRSVQVLQHVLPERKRPGGKKKIPSTSSQDIAVSMSKGLLRTATTPLSTSSEAKKSNSSSRGGKHESRSTSQGRGGSSDGLGEGAHPSGSSTRDTSNYGADYGLEQLVVHPLFAGGRIFSALVFSRLFAQVRAARRLLLAACRLQ